MTKSWRDEILNLLDIDVLDLEKLKQAKIIRNNNIPASLYKYRTVTDYSLENLSDSTLYLAKANTFNDPYDSVFNFDLGIGYEDNRFYIERLGIPDDESIRIFASDDPLKEVIKFALKGEEYSAEKADLLTTVIKEGRAKFNKQQLNFLNSNLQNSYKICSVSERLDSLPMWAHYADNHKGFVMEYDFNKLPSHDLVLNCLWPVFYKGIYDASNIIKSLNEGKLFNNLVAILAALHKSSDWEYESEWRLVLPDVADKAGINLSAPLKAVYLGSKLEDSKESNNLSRVLECAEAAQVPVFRMHLIPEEFRVEAKPL
jgi:hypothetical protein